MGQNLTSNYCESRIPIRYVIKEPLSVDVIEIRDNNKIEMILKINKKNITKS